MGSYWLINFLLLPTRIGSSVGETQRDVVRGQEVSASERQGMASGGLRQRAQQVQFTDSFLEMKGPTKKFPRLNTPKETGQISDRSANTNVIRTPLMDTLVLGTGERKTF